MTTEFLPHPWVASDGTIRATPLGLADGRLILPAQAKPLQAEAVKNLDELLVPGCIDSHVHFRQPGHTRKEGITNGSRAALAGGVCTDLQDATLECCTGADSSDVCPAVGTAE